LRAQLIRFGPHLRDHNHIEDFPYRCADRSRPRFFRGYHLRL